MKNRKGHEQCWSCESWTRSRAIYYYGPGMEQDWFYREDSRNQGQALIGLTPKSCPGPLLPPPFCKASLFFLLPVSLPPLLLFRQQKVPWPCQEPVLPLAIKDQQVTWMNAFPPETSNILFSVSWPDTSTIPASMRSFSPFRESFYIFFGVILKHFLRFSFISVLPS